MPEFNPIIPLDLSSNGPSQDVNVPSVADPTNYNPQDNRRVTDPNDNPRDDNRSIFEFSKASSLEEHPITFNPRDAEGYDKLNYNPLANNEEDFARTQGLFSKIGNTAIRFTGGTVGAFAETIMSIPDLLHAIGTGTISNAYKNPIAQAIDDFNDLLTEIKNEGGEVTDSYPQYNTIYAYIPVQKIELVAENANVNSISIPSEGTTN